MHTETKTPSTEQEYSERESLTASELAKPDPYDVSAQIVQPRVDTTADFSLEKELREREREIQEEEANGDYYSEPLFLSEFTPKEGEIEIVVFHPGQYPRLIKVENTLSTLQKLVGGLIEVFPVGVEGAVGVCNEDFLGLGLTPNRHIRATQSVICGTFFVAGDGINFCSLSERQIVEVLVNI